MRLNGLKIKVNRVRCIHGNPGQEYLGAHLIFLILKSKNTVVGFYNDPDENQKPGLGLDIAGVQLLLHPCGCFSRETPACYKGSSTFLFSLLIH